MGIITPFESREYLALKINYCRTGLAKLPDVKISSRTVESGIVKVCMVGSHVYRCNTDYGQKYLEIAQKRMALESELIKLEGIWNSQYRCPVPEDYKPHNVVRQFDAGGHELVSLDKAFFDSLKNDANPNYRDKKFYPFNGVYYRSNPEREIAFYYTEHGIPFKYEPEVWLAGLNRPIHPDFVFYIRELNLCKFHEHLGLMNKSGYLRDYEIRNNNYTNAGLITDFDVLFTYDMQDKPFDPRELDTTINHAVYKSMLLL